MVSHETPLLCLLAALSLSITLYSRESPICGRWNGSIDGWEQLFNTPIVVYATVVYGMHYYVMLPECSECDFRIDRHGMEQRILSIEIRAVSKAVDRYLGESMPLSAKETTGGNAHIIMFLARNRDRGIYQHTIEQKFCITRSTASRVLALMEKKGLIARESVAHDARCKRIVLTDKADAIVADLKANGERVERLLVDGFTQAEQDALHDYVERMRANIERAQHEFEHQTSSQTPSTAAPEYSEAEVINTKEENK